MRWDGQTIEADDQQRLPGYADGAVVRRFDAPEALDMRFYEVRAKSAINRVPGASRVPFRWTINPYRGCAHACSYCGAGDTPILLANGRTRPLAELAVGDRILGTELRGRYRRYVETEVLDQWSVIKPAYRTTLEDGTELITSGDHRFLTERGWKHVTETDCRLEQRPHLTLNNQLLGTGRFTSPPDDSYDYRRGYLCGLIRGDAHLASRPYQRADGRPWTHHAFRLALVDDEALCRAHEYLSDVDVTTTRFVFQAATSGRREVRALGTQARAGVERIRGVIEWPVAPRDDWRKGFLAGIFDAEGSCDGQVLRIANTDRLILDWTLSCLRHFGFDALEEGGANRRVRYVRLRGGLRERLRFFHLTDPAITRKRTITDTALKSDARTRVVSVEPLGIAMRLYDITTGTGDYIANGVVSHNCFARPTHEYLDLNAGRDFEREIVVKVNLPEVLRAELARPSWCREPIAMGTNTDPYQWVEGRYKLMRGIWEALRDAGNDASILTKSPLVLRDVDLLRELGERADVSACLSVPTLEEKAWRATEPHTPHPRARLEAVAELNRQGIRCGVLIAPLMPGINDAPEQVERTVALAREANAAYIGGQALFLRGSVRDVFFDWLRDDRPDLVSRYEELYRDRAYLKPGDRRATERALPGPAADEDPGRFSSRRRRTAARAARQPSEATEPRRVPRQEALF